MKPVALTGVLTVLLVGCLAAEDQDIEFEEVEEIADWIEDLESESGVLRESLTNAGYNCQILFSHEPRIQSYSSSFPISGSFSYSWYTAGAALIGPECEELCYNLENQFDANLMEEIHQEYPRDRIIYIPKDYRGIDLPYNICHMTWNRPL